MKKYLIINSLLLLVLATVTSCDSYLEEQNPNEISSDIYWSTLEESESNLTSVYGAMLDERIYTVDTEAWRSDEAHAGGRFNNNAAVKEQDVTENARNWYEQQFDENMIQLQDRWNAIYQVIFRANQVIEGLDSMTEDLKSNPRWTEQMGQARFFRGLGHFYLHSVYNHGKIVVRDKNPLNIADFHKPVSESSEVIEFFREDLKYAYENLPGQMEPRTRVDAGAAGTILGMSYLYEKEFAEAEAVFDDIINNKNKDYGYSLVQDWTLMFTKAGDFNSESIFEINYSDHIPVVGTTGTQEDFSQVKSRTAAPRDAGGRNPNRKFTAAAWLIEAYASDELDVSDPRNTVIDRAGVTRLRKVSLRNSAMLAVVNDEDAEYYLAPSAPVRHNFAFAGLYGFFKKYTNHDFVADERDIGENSFQSFKNVVVNRLSGVYLMMAECKLELGKLDEGLFYINEIRKRWGLLALEGEDYDTVEEVTDRLRFYEYPMELCVEGFSTRNIDLRRWGVGKQRFEELSQLDFYATDYTYLNEDADGTGTRQQCLVVKGVTTDEDDLQLNREYVQAAQFYSDGYLPLPASETINNPNVSN
ncbi:RagB/SusD family nutrient uptake outer membrane protein [Flavivirga abyssicola]|uniref:RagB/SusD family nutrient uptake outer membrane protein n=1 Tax=Flavivirga abyssicola TaxID=3063533 RepID=UPI0026DEFF80|nr:RagB/SusD family nutrient uptake outer membrane protein [Flavivirga sp. MEBiC07777]WVK13748.1 RagB/SusD family nutrient uptake outer membrane protein [Flavivirga sp. MEBiC07777]